MTVTYTAEVATCRGFGCFLKLLLRWRGSIYKLVWLDLLAFLFLYYLLSLVYRYALNDQQRVTFEIIVQYCYNYSDLIPLSFVLGFYVSIVMTRWWNQYTSIPWPDPIAVFVSANIHGQDERGRMVRRTIMRYVCLCLTMVMTNISPRVKKRFPNLSNFVEAGLLNENEKDIIESMNKGFPRHSKHWLPIVWAASIVTRARKEGRIRDDFAVKTIIDELNKFRGQCGLLISYDTISVPLVYTQVVTLAVYSYFLCSVMGQQWTDNKVVANTNAPNKVDLYFPVFTTLQFFFYMGWLKVAESLINPFGEDDDDFEVNWMVDRNLQVSYLIVDEMHHEHPELLKDQYWDEVFPNELPYTIASERFREEHPEPSTAKIEVSKNAAMPTVMSSVRIDDMADDASGIHFTAGNGKTRPGSSPSLVSLSGTLSRVNTVASALKRFLSRDDSRPGSVTPNDDTQKYKFPGSASSASLAPNANKPAGSMRITDQVIEEVDEQATITSHRGTDHNRPNVRDIFYQGGPDGPGHSEPMDIPSKNKIYMRTQSSGEPHLFPPGGVEALLSTSAPTADSPSMARTVPSSPVGESSKSLHDQLQRDQRERGSRETDIMTCDKHFSIFPQAQLIGRNDGAVPQFRWFLSTGTKSLVFSNRKTTFLTVEDMEMRSTTDLIAAADANEETDDFEKLKAEREKERHERQKQKLARTISTAPGGTEIVPVVAAAIIPPPQAAAAAPVAPSTQATTAASNAGTPVSTMPPSSSVIDLMSITEPVQNSTTNTNEDEENRE
ncbi:bestrophin-4 isoform X4 [Stomoxys calcitrans]|uniref:Bestrophin homolog n=1 Tax=Stomoxys calcitrans TaxID=35570 RepID=A0A1I8NTT2_STOCA|nr:bestrophin-4 isoform X4 [Stomoxys calcitrans]